MNQFFSFRRGLLLVSKHFAEQKRAFALSLLALAGLLVFWFVLVWLIDQQDYLPVEVQRNTYFLALFATGSFYTCRYFRGLGRRSQGIPLLLLPASTFEKLLCGLLFTTLLFFVGFTATFYLADALVLALLPNGDGRPGAPVNVFETELFRFPDGTPIYLLLVYFAVQSFFLFGSVFFKRHAFVKTMLSGFVLYALLFFLVYLAYRQYNPGDDPSIRLPGWIGWTVAIGLTYVVMPVFWLLTYYRMKRTQV